MHHIICIFIFTLALLPTHGASQEAHQLSPLLKELDEIQGQENVAAYAIVITTANNILVAENRGTTAVNSKKPVAVAKDAYFRVGSITKSFLGLAAIIAQQQGLLTIQQPVIEFIGTDYFTNPWQGTAPITLAQLLQHSAGLPDMSSRREFNYATPVTNREGLELFAKSRRVLWQPGRFYSYSNTGFGLAGLVIEESSGVSINEFLDKRVFSPLGMNSATLEYTDTVREHLVPGFDRDGASPLPYWHMIFPAFGALNIQPREMANFLQLYLNRGRFNGQQLVSETNMQRLEQPTTTLAALEGLTYGYGLGIYNWYKNGHEFFGHGGDGDGYLARFGYSHEAQLAYFVVINSFQHTPINRMQSAIEAWVIKGLPEVSYPQPYPLKNSKSLRGTYTSLTARFGQIGTQQLEIFVNDGILFSRLGQGRARELIPVNEKHFRRRTEPEATIVILQTENETIFMGDEGNFLKSDK